MSKKDRRRFLKATGTVAATGLIGGMTGAIAQCSDNEVLITGISKKGNLQEALGDAIAKALAQGPQHPDVLVNYEVRSIKGSAGGIAGISDLMVTICARFA